MRQRQYIERAIRKNLRQIRIPTPSDISTRRRETLLATLVAAVETARRSRAGAMPPAGAVLYAVALSEQLTRLVVRCEFIFPGVPGAAQALPVPALAAALGEIRARIARVLAPA